ncbi:MAG: hypothetical protein ACO3AT_04245 [Ilumatobacteraceae bacterium]
MRVVKALLRRISGRDVRALRVEVAEIRNQVQVINDVVQSLNHDVRSGADRSLPLFLGYAERVRLDADTAMAAVQSIERQIARLEVLIDAASTPSNRS